MYVIHIIRIALFSHELITDIIFINNDQIISREKICIFKVIIQNLYMKFFLVYIALTK